MNKIRSFQILRAAAATMIFLSHCVPGLGWWGGTGVSLFIALSGFLAVMKYKDIKVNSVQLYKARWKQFYKLHIITLIASIVLPAYISSINISQEWFKTLFLNLSLTQTLFPNSGIYFSFNAVSWYLSLTLMFALLTPVSIKLYHRFSCKGIIAALISIRARIHK